MKFTVYIDDNFHYMDPQARSRLGEFDTEAEAVAAAKRVIDDFFAQTAGPGLAADQLFELYAAFGEEPWISPACPFNAREYASQRCRELNR
jgi:hypothetical protein